MSKIHITADDVQEYVKERDYPKNTLDSLFAFEIDKEIEEEK